MAKAPRVPGETKGESAAPASTAQPLPATPQPGLAGLPNAVDIDPDKITQATLTKQGWVVPSEKKAKA